MKTIRVGAGLGFYGDSWRPVRASIERGGVQYIASDHLSELTLAILQKDRQKDPSAGYARDGLPMLAELWPLAAKQGVKFVLNAGGLNPHACREKIFELARELGVKGLRVGVVEGDDKEKGRLNAIRSILDLIPYDYNEAAFTPIKLPPRQSMDEGGYQRTGFERKFLIKDYYPD